MYLHFLYRAMLRGIATASRLSVRLSVALRYCDHVQSWLEISQNTSKIIFTVISLGSSLFADPSWIYYKRNTPNFSRNRKGVWKKVALGVRNPQKSLKRLQTARFMSANKSKRLIEISLHLPKLPRTYVKVTQILWPIVYNS